MLTLIIAAGYIARARGAVLTCAALNLALTTIIFAVVFLGEEIGWRGYLFFRLAELMSGRRAALVTGAFHAIFHLPLLVLTTTTYQSERNRWIVVPIVMITLTLAGVWYGWLRFVVGKHLAGQSFSQRLQQSDGDGCRHCYNDVAGMAYVTTETAVATMIIMVLVAGYLLTRRAADFAKAEPTSTLDPPLAHPVHVSPDPQRVSRRQLNLTGSSGPAGRAPARGVAVGRGGASTVLAAATVGEHMPELIGRMGHANTSARSESCKRSYLGNGPTHSIGSPGALRAPTGAAPTR